MAYGSRTPRSSSPRDNGLPSPTARTPHDYLKPRPRHDGVIQSPGFPVPSHTTEISSSRTVGTIDTRLPEQRLDTPQRGLIQHSWPTFSNVSRDTLHQAAERLMDRLQRDGLSYQAIDVGSTSTREPLLLLYMDRALRDNDMVPTEIDGIAVQRVTVGKFRLR